MTWCHHRRTICCKAITRFSPLINFSYSGVENVWLIHLIVMRAISVTYFNVSSFTHCGRVTHIWLVAWSAPSHYQNQCWNIVNKTLRNKLQWICSQNSIVFIQENAFESVVCEKAAILARPQWVKIISDNRSDVTLAHFFQRIIKRSQTSQGWSY